MLSLQWILRSWLTKKNPKLAAWFDDIVELQLIHNSLYLTHLQSKLSSAPRLSPLGISFPSLLDPQEKRFTCSSPYSLSYLKNKNSLQRPSWTRHQMLEVLEHFHWLPTQTKGRLFTVCLVLFPALPSDALEVGCWQKWGTGWIPDLYKHSNLCSWSTLFSQGSYTCKTQITWAHK